MSITPELYESIKGKYGQYSSWAIWDGKDTGAWADREYQPDLGRRLKPNIVMVGLNPSADILEKEYPFDNFHDPKNPRAKLRWRTLENARNLPFAFWGTKYAGAYMTDIIKLDTINEIDRGKLAHAADVMKFLRTNPETWEKNINRFRRELEVIQSAGTEIIAFGKKVSEVLDGPPDMKIGIPHKQIPHYSHPDYWGKKPAYREAVAKILDLSAVI